MPKYTLEKLHNCVFVRRGYKLRLFNDDGTNLLRLVNVCDANYRKIGTTLSCEPLLFLDNDGRKARSAALRVAREYNATPY